MRIVGLDLSLTGAAACAIPTDWDQTLGRVQTKVYGYQLPKEATDRDRLQRFHTIAEGVVEFCRSFPHGSDEMKVYVEQYAFSQSGAMSSEIRECGGIVKYRLWRKLGIIAAPVIASQARKMLLIKLPRAKVKDYVVANVRRLEGSARVWSHDEIDAFVCANYGVMLVGGVAMTFDGVA